MKKKPGGPGRILAKALTKEQLESLIDAVGSETLLEKLEKKNKHGDYEMADTVKRALASTGASRKKRDRSGAVISSDRKFIEEWNDLWSRWDDCIGEVGEEDGKYILQEHHWEPPWFDGSALASDLEKIAEEMTGRIKRAFALVDEPDLFTTALEDIDRAIRSYPDWMGADDGDGCILEYHTSHCVLQWIRLSTRDGTRTGSTFLDKMESIDSGIRLVSFDRQAIVDFVAGMPEKVCREIFDELSKGRFEDEQKNVYSPWNALMLDFKRRFDKDGYLDQCGRDLKRNWLLGRPLVEKSLKDRDWKGAEAWLSKTFSAFIRKEKTGWFPETSLLDSDANLWREHDDKVEATKLLLIWSDVAEKQNNAERAAAARLQASVMRSPEAVQRIIDEYIELRDRTGASCLNLLFRKWQNETAQRSFRLYHDSGRTSETWFHWVAAACVDGKTGVSVFRKKLDSWLASLNESGDEFKKQKMQLACLTADLASEIDRSRFAGILKTAFDDFRRKTDLDRSRGKMVRELCIPGTVDTIFEIWKKHFIHLVPDPSSSGSDYRQPVACAKVLHDLNPEAYTRLIMQWTKKHRLRRNLWSALKKEKLPAG